jgi:membrane-associated protein
LDPATLAGGGLLIGCSALVFAESGILLGFFLPGDTVLFAAGLATASPRVGVATWLLALCVGIAAVAGDALGFTLGLRYGRPALERRVARRLGVEKLEQAEAFYDRYGAFALIAARFIPWVRTFVPLLAGATRMRYGRFALGNITGALIWAVGLVVLGRLSATVPGLKTAAVTVAITVVALSFVIPSVTAARHVIRRQRSHSERH